MARRSGWRDAAEYAIARAVVGSVALCPRPLADTVARGWLALLDCGAPRLRRAARRNLALAFPHLSPAAREGVADGVFRSLARQLVAFSRFPRLDAGNISSWIRYEGFPHFEAALARGRGVLFATAHLGAWELSAFAHALLTAPMHIVVRPLDNRRLDAWLERRRTLSGNRVIGKRDFARPILRALAENQAVGILIDQNVAAPDGLFVDFFGVPACTSPAFVRLAARSGAAVIPGFAVWEESERRYVLRFDPPVPMSGDPQADAQAVTRRLEETIRAYPDQWLWIHRRWKTRPPGEPPLY